MDGFGNTPDVKVKRSLTIVSKSTGYLISTLEGQLKQDGFDTSVASNLSSFNKIGSELSGCVLYLDEDVITDDKLLIYLRDRVTEDDLPVFLIGDEGEMNTVKKYIPTMFIAREYLRPINVKNLAGDIRKYFETRKEDTRKVILAVDDSGVMLKSIKNWLGDKYDMMLADSALAAIKNITVRRPDLIILDYEMPIIDGKKTIAMIRAEKDFADIPVIFLTGRQDRESIETVMEYKPNGYLLKSMKPFAVRKYIDEFFEKLDRQKKLDSLK